ncbi:histone-lysine N-methyltransferase SETMAR [Trichonephila clavipes]|nr:histone-lysine N-methyltransferase SETMAR [Trichonephila clavipes]
MTLLRAQVEANPCQTIEELLNAFNQPWSTIQEYLQQIGKTNRADEKWVLYDNPKRKRQWLCPNEPPRRTAKPGLHLKMLLLYMWWGIHGIVHIEVLKHGETVYADLYCEQLDRLNQSLIEKYPVIINRKDVLLKHNNARPHCARKTLEKMNRLGWEGRYVVKIPLKGDPNCLGNSRGIALKRLNAFWEDNKHDRVKTYEPQKFTYGITRAPYVERRTLKQLSYNEENKFPTAVPVLQSNFYMDNGLCGAETLEEANELQHQLIAILKSAGMELHKMCGNHFELLAAYK